VASAAWPVDIVVGGVVVDPRIISGSVSVSSGSVSVSNFPATQLVSGTVAATQGTSPWVDSVTGSVTANAGTNLNTSLLALESGGNLATLAGGVSSSKYQIRALTSADVVTTAQGAAASTSSPWPVDIVVGGVAIDPRIISNFPSSFSISNSTLAVTQSTSPWVTSGTTTATQGTAGSASAAWPVGIAVSGAIVDPRSIRALTSADAVTTVPPSNASTNVTQWNTTSLGVPTAYGTAPTTGNYLGANVFVTNTPTVSGTVTANQGTHGTAANGWFSELTDGVNTAGVAPAVTAATTSQPAVVVASSPNTIAQDNVSQVGGTAVAAQAKGTQASNFFPTQDVINSGRTEVNYYATGAAAGATTVETLLTLTQASGTGATTTGTSFVITAGKTFRMTSLTFATRGNTATATAQITTFSLRINTGGTCVVTSTPIAFQAVSGAAATLAAFDRFQVPIPDGWEIAGNGTLAICVTANSTFVTNAPTLDVEITGFQY
jgi:hypothetical protein